MYDMLLCFEARLLSLRQLTVCRKRNCVIKNSIQTIATSLAALAVATALRMANRGLLPMKYPDV